AVTVSARTAAVGVAGEAGSGHSGGGGQMPSGHSGSSGESMVTSFLTGPTAPARIRAGKTIVTLAPTAIGAVSEHVNVLPAGASQLPPLPPETVGVPGANANPGPRVSLTVTASAVATLPSFVTVIM